MQRMTQPGTQARLLEVFSLINCARVRAPWNPFLLREQVYARVYVRRRPKKQESAQVGPLENVYIAADITECKLARGRACLMQRRKQLVTRLSWVISLMQRGLLIYNNARGARKNAKQD